MKFWLLVILIITIINGLTVEHEKKRNKRKSKKYKRCDRNWDCNSGQTCTTKQIKGRDVSVCKCLKRKKS